MLYTFLLQGSGAQLALVVMSSVSSLTRENGNTVPCEVGGNWELGKPDRSAKYSKNKEAGK